MLTPTPASKIQANLQDLFQANLTSGEAYIRFKLTTDITALLSMKQVQRSVIVEAEKITPMPGMPESVIGIMSSRDRVFCLFDLAQLLGLSVRLAVPRQYQIIVLQTIGSTPIQIGFSVNNLQGIVRLSTEQIQAASDAVPANIQPYAFGEVSTEQETIPILAFERIVNTLTAA